MKNQSKIKSFLMLLTLAIMFGACGAKKSTGVATINKGAIADTWTVNSVTLEGFPSGYKVTDAFGMAPYQDFTNSIWKLNGNYGGSITLANGTSQEVFWSLYGERITPIFQFKKMDGTEKAKNVSEGYQLEIFGVDKNQLTMKSPIRLASGNTAYIVYSFIK